MNTLTVNDVKKDLYKSKVNAKFSHYCAGKLYYTVELQNGEIYQFPISTTEPIIVKGTQTDWIGGGEDIPFEYEEGIQLSTDLGQTPFSDQIKASELNRWIAKAFDKGEFICINKAPETHYETEGIQNGHIFPTEDDQVMGTL